MSEKTSLEIVTFKTSSIRLACPVHGEVKVQSAYDPFLKKMTGISCAECPTITKEIRELIDRVREDERSKYTKKVTRFEVIDHTPCKRCSGTGWLDINGKKRTCIDCKTAGLKGRVLVAYNMEVELSVQDQGRTLKVFLKERK